MKFFDAFGGIGGFRLGMERAGHQCVGYCEIDPAAVGIYNHRFGEHHDANDIRNLRDLPDFDILCGGFPDEWTKEKVVGGVVRPVADGVRYGALGNALPPAFAEAVGTGLMDSRGCQA